MDALLTLASHLSMDLPLLLYSSLPTDVLSSSDALLPWPLLYGPLKKFPHCIYFIDYNLRPAMLSSSFLKLLSFNLMITNLFRWYTLVAKASLRTFSRSLVLLQNGHNILLKTYSSYFVPYFHQYETLQSLILPPFPPHLADSYPHWIITLKFWVFTWFATFFPPIR